MADAAVGAIIQPLVQKLLTLAEEKINLFRHFKSDLETLRESLITVQAFLHDAGKKQVTSRAVKVWLRQLEDLAFDADNVIDEVHYELLSKKVHLVTDEIEDIENKTVKEKEPSCFSRCSIFWQNKTVKKKINERLENHPISFRLEMGCRIKDINERLEKINQRATAFNLQSLASAQDRMDAYENREENAFAKDPVFLGRENEVSEIVKMLITIGPDGQKSSYVLPIVGMGGKGKTTIAREVFHDERIISHFGDKNRVWVYVSQNFDVRNILKNILTSITTGKSDLETQQDILKELQEHWGDKKYLLVLDDVWNKNKEVWDGFFNSLLGISSANGFCMIVTTRIEDVASIVKTHCVHKLEVLPDDDCWSIIKANAFKGENVPVDFEEMGKNIAKKCQGLPLAAKVVGGLLLGMKSKDEWKSIEENWLSDAEDSISNVLKLSFDHLPSQSLKKCFAYCSIFPKGYKIEKQQLVELWMAEGFLPLQTDHQKSNINMEVTGTKFLNLLLHNSLLQVVQRDRNGNVTHCNMHDLVHDVACSILCEKGNCKRRYIGYKPSGDGLSSIPKGQDQRYVRTLFCKGPNIKFLNDLESLHTLTLVDYDIHDFPTSIKKLKHLRYLDISKTLISSLPNWIGELYHLQTLRLRNKENMFVSGRRISKLPNSFNCLISLRHLHIFDYPTLPPKMGKLASLQTLPYFDVGDEKGYGISELGPLKNLKGELEICNLYKVRNKDEAMGADLIGKTGIEKLKLSWLDWSWDVHEVYKASVHESVLEGLQPHPNLERLKISGFKGKILSLCWEGLKNLTEIKLEYCKQCEELPMLGLLRNLKYLKLRRLTNLKCLPDGLFSNNHNLSNMKVIECPNITHLVLFSRGGRASSLRMLRIYDCSSLRELHSLNSLEDLIISNCPDLKSIQYPSSKGGGHESQQQQGFTSLRKLYISNCKGLTDLPIEMLEPCALSLESLTLEKLSSLTNISEVIRCFQKMTRLTYLHIWDVPKFIFELHSKRLTMGPPASEFNKDSSCNNISFNKTFDLLQPSQLFTSLRYLDLGGRDHWDCLPYRLQHLTSLEKLYVSDFGIEALPEWFGNLSSLETLTLSNCKRLRHLPSKQAMQRLSKLTTLEIKFCPMLEKEKGSDTIDDNNSEGPQIADSEWSKISHIPIVKVNLSPYSHHRH